MRRTVLRAELREYGNRPIEGGCGPCVEQGEPEGRCRVTAEQIAAMGDRQLNREIARICEWKLDDFDSGIPPRGGPVVQFIPDYCRDLNAAMGLVPEGDHIDGPAFDSALRRVCGGCGWEVWGMEVSHALKPRKLAEAWLLWQSGREGVK